MGLSRSKALENVIRQMVDVLCVEAAQIKKDLRKWESVREESIEKLANITELKIRRKQVKIILQKIEPVIKKSTYQILLSVMEVEDN